MTHAYNSLHFIKPIVPCKSANIKKVHVFKIALGKYARYVQHSQRHKREDFIKVGMNAVCCIQ
jgi:hypothetical protein